MTNRLEEIRAREKAAMRGPWGWRGNIGYRVELVGLHGWGPRIISSNRVEKCTDYVEEFGIFLRDDPCDACREAFKLYCDGVHQDDLPKCERAQQHDTVWVWEGDPNQGHIVPINGCAKAEVLEWSDHMYRDDVKDTTHPDAEFIAKAREDIPWLLGVVDELQGQLDVALGELLRIEARRPAPASILHGQESAPPREAVELKNGQKFVCVHPASMCESDPACMFHNPTEHPLEMRPLQSRHDRAFVHEGTLLILFERRCPHGVGHPDPDCVSFLESVYPNGWGVHGCDGCCQGKKFGADDD